jgi:hypothetical protein
LRLDAVTGFLVVVPVLVLDHTIQQQAEDAAVLWCDVIGKTNDCLLAPRGGAASRSPKAAMGRRSRRDRHSANRPPMPQP